jgi:hypothetical protein
VSAAATKKAIIERDPKCLKTADRLPEYAANLRKQVREGKDDDGKVLSEADRKYLTEFANSVDFDDW